MLEDINSGAGAVKFFAHKWSSDADATVSVQYSTDGGSTWKDASSVNVTTTDYQEMSVSVNVAGKLRLRFLQTAGQRWLIDNISVEAYSKVKTVRTDGDWIAYARGGQIIIENAPKGRVEIYSVDGRKADTRKIEGNAAIDLPTNLYIVVINDTARRVVVK